MRDLALFFLRLGLTAFGGPAVHVAIMERECVQRLGWVPREEFLDYLGAVNLIPGPNSTEMTMLIGQRRAGWRGLIVAGGAFILPAALITGIMAWAYMRWGALDGAQPVLRGIQSAVVPVIVIAVARLGRQACKSMALLAVTLVAAGAAALHLNEIATLFLCGGIYGFWRGRPSLTVAQAARTSSAPPPCEFPRGLPLRLAVLIAAVASVVAVFAWLTRGGAAASPGLVTLYFIKIGSLLYGGGYVLFAFLQSGLVETMHWLTPRQLVDAVAAGQITPGPLFSTATFVGYVSAGWLGAVGATVGIFLPGFLFAAALHPLAAWARGRAATAHLLDGINAAALGLMAYVAVRFIGIVASDLRALLLAFLFFGLAAKTSLNTAWIVLAGAAAGWIVLS